MKTIVIAFGVIWLVIIAFLVGTQFYSVEKESFQLATMIPILVGLITILPLYINCQILKKEIKKEGFNILF